MCVDLLTDMKKDHRSILLHRQEGSSQHIPLFCMNAELHPKPCSRVYHPKPKFRFRLHNVHA
eukprot:XP_001704969.1 Hypothetical protein GL50803_23735 [Giardia lamblia ATCC 50803]